MRLKSLELNNYTSYRQLKIDNFKDLVAIVGLNGAGKSNIYLALETALTHGSFTEDDLYLDRITKKRAKSGSITVGIEVENGIRYITRTREGSKQSLILRWEDGKVEEFRTIKDKELYDIVAKFTGFHRIKLDINDKTGKCIQFVPLDETTPFLITGNSNEVVLRKVNTLASGAQIEKAKILIEKDVRKAETDLKVLQKLVEEKEQSKSNVSEDLLVELSECMENIDKLTGKIERLVKKREKLTLILAQYKELMSTREQVKSYPLSLVEKSISKVEKRVNAIKELIAEKQDLLDKKGDYICFIEVINNKIDALSKLEKQLDIMNKTFCLEECDTCDCYRYKKYG